MGGVEDDVQDDDGEPLLIAEHGCSGTGEERREERKEGGREGWSGGVEVEVEVCG